MRPASTTDASPSNRASQVASAAARSIAWGRIDKPADVLTVGQQIDAKVLKIEPAGKRISLGMKQLQPHPWDAVAGKYTAGERVRGKVTRVTDFGAFVELEPGIEGMIHLSEMSWAKKVRKPGDMVKPGDVVEVMILGVNAAERRISLGLKQTLGDPWADASEKFVVGSQVEGPVTRTWVGEKPVPPSERTTPPAPTDATQAGTTAVGSGATATPDPAVVAPAVEGGVRE